MPHCVACNVKLTPANELQFGVSGDVFRTSFYTCHSSECITVVYDYSFPSCKQRIA